VADVELDDFRQCRYAPRSFIVKPVAGMAFESELAGVTCRHDDALEFVFGPLRFAMHMRIAPRAGVEFDDRCADRFRRIDRAARGLDEKRNSNSGPA
jgi:hypothetical protein